MPRFTTGVPHARKHTKKAYAADDGGTRTAAAAAMVESSKKSKWSAVPQISVMM